MTFTRSVRPFGAMLIAVLMMASMPTLAEQAVSDARTDLIGLWEKMVGKHDLSYRVNSTITSGRDKPIKQMVEVQWPNRFHMKSDQSEMIILPSGTWMNMDGNWMKMPIDMQKIIAQFTPEAMRQSMEMTQNVRFVGLDTVNGTPVKVYLYDFDGKVMGIRSSGQSKMFLGIADGYPLRIETTGKAMGRDSTTIAEYEYDDSIRIEAP